MTTTRPEVTFREISPQSSDEAIYYEHGPAGGHTFSSLVSERDSDNLDTMEQAGWVIAALGVFIFCAVLVGHRYIKQ